MVNKAPKILLTFIINYINDWVRSEKDQRINFNQHFEWPPTCVLNMYIHQVTENPEHLEKPDNNNNDNHDIEDCFDFSIHGDVCVYKP